MINNLQISGIRVNVDDQLRTYVRKKIGGLDKYIPRRARESTFVEVKFKEKNSKDKQRFQCEVIMKLPKSKITVHKDSLSQFAAIDEAEDNLKNQLKKYKDMHTPSRMRRHVLSRFSQNHAPGNIT